MLSVGGYVDSGDAPVTTNAELYDPLLRTWSSVPPMLIAHARHQVWACVDGRLQEKRHAQRVTCRVCCCTCQVVTLHDNSVLVIGGQNGQPYMQVPPSSVPLSVYTSCELWNPATGEWTATGAMSVPRYGHRATLLPSGKVLVAGGYTGGTDVQPQINITASAELFKPTTGQWSPAADMPFARTEFEMLTLPSGLAFVGGGFRVAAGSAFADTATDTLFFDEGANSWASGTDLIFFNEHDTSGPIGIVYRQ